MQVFARRARATKDERQGSNGSLVPPVAEPNGSGWCLEAMTMFTIRNFGGVALLLAGTTWLWLTPAFASRGVTTSGSMWAITRVLSLVTVALFCIATWGLFTRQGWWEAVALGSCAVGLLAVVVFSIAARGSGETVGTVMWNAFVHVVMVAGVLTLLLVPQLERWVDRHVSGG
jgi:hypothetical protein